MAVSIDTSTIAQALNSTNSTSLTIANNSNRLLLVAVAHTSTSQTCTGVTWNGTSLTKLEALSCEDVGSTLEYYYLVNPESGTYNVVSSYSGVISQCHLAISLYDVNQTDPFGSRGMGTVNNNMGTSYAMTVETAGSMIITSGVTESSNLTTPTNFTQIQYNNSVIQLASAYRSMAGVGISNAGYSTNTTRNEHLSIAVEVKPYGVAETAFSSNYPIKFVASSVGGSNSATYTLKLPQNIEEGDVILLNVVHSKTSDEDMSVAGYTELADLFSDDTDDTNQYVGYQVVGSSIPTSVTVPGSGSSGRAGVSSAYVFRNVDTSNPIGVTTTTSTGINANNSNPPSISPLSGMVVLGFYAGTDQSSPSQKTLPSSPYTLSNNYMYGSSACIHNAAIMAYHCDDKNLAYDPDAFSGGATSTSDAWTAATVALRPQKRGMPYVVAVGTAVSATTGSLTVSWPLGAREGDIGLLFVECQGSSSSLSTASGFTEIGEAVSATGTTLQVFWARATSRSMADVVKSACDDHQHGVIVTFRNCKVSGNPYSTTATSTKDSASTTSTTPTVTTTSDGNLIIHAFTSDVDSASAFASAPVNAVLNNFVELYDGGTTSGNGGGIAVVQSVLPYTGATGTTAHTVTSSRSALRTIALVGAGDHPTSVTPTSPANEAETEDTTPDLVFSGIDPESDDIRYFVQISDSSFPSTSGPIDTFRNGYIDPNVWIDGSQTSSSLSSAGINLTVPAMYGRNLKTLSSYDFTDSQISVKVLDVNPGETATVAFVLISLVSADLANKISYTVVGTSLTCEKVVSSSYTAVDNEAYDPDVHKYFRIRESGGVTYWEYSTDGKSWTTQYSENTPITVTSLNVLFEAINFGGASTESATWSDWNIPVADVEAISGTDAGFSGDPDNSDPFTSGQSVTYTVQNALDPDTYYWRVGGSDPNGSNYWGAWSSVRSFTVSGTGVVEETKTFTADGVVKLVATKTFTIDGTVKTTLTGTFTADGIVTEKKTDTFTIDGVVKVGVTDTFTTDGVVKAVQTDTFTADGLVVATQTDTFTTDGIVKVAETEAVTVDGIVKSLNTKTFTADGIVKDVVTDTMTIDGIVAAVNTSEVTIDGIVSESLTHTFTIDGMVKAVGVKGFTVDGIVETEVSDAITVDAIVLVANSKTFTTDGIVKSSSTDAVTVDGAVKSTESDTVTIDGVVTVVSTSQLTIDGIVSESTTEAVTVDGIVKAILAQSYTIDGVVKEIQTESVTVDGVVEAAQAKDFTIDGVVQASQSEEFTIDGIVKAPGGDEVTIDALIKEILTDTFTLGGVVQAVQDKGFTIDGVVLAGDTETVTIDGIVKLVASGTFNVDGIVKQLQENAVTIDGLVLIKGSETFTLDGIMSEGEVGVFTVDGIVKESLSNQFTLGGIVLEQKSASHTADGIVKEVHTDTITADGIVKSPGQKTFTVDGIVSSTETQDFTVDGVIVHTQSLTADGVVLVPAENTFGIDGIIGSFRSPALTDRAVGLAEDDDVVMVSPFADLYW